MRFNRRDMLLSGVAAGLSLLGPSSAFSSTPTKIESLRPVIKPKLRLWNRNTDERASLTFWRDGRYDAQAVRRFNWFMRDWREDEAVRMSEGLMWGLAAISEAAQRDGHNGEIEVFSGYRSRRTNNLLRRQSGGVASNSLHMRAEAVDFRLDGLPTRDIAKYAQWLEIGGVGHYRNRFVHIDTGPIRDWGSAVD